MSGPWRSDDRPWRWLVGAILVGFVAAAWYGRQRGIHWGGDDADYALLARGLRDLRYHDAFLVGAPPHTTYPPVYPALLSIWGLLFGDGIGSAAALNILLVTATLAITAQLVRVHASAPVAAVVLLVTAANPYVLEYAGRMMSEAPTMFFAAGTIYFADRGEGRWGVAGAIACSVLCALTRTAGVAVIAGLGVHWLLQRRWKETLLLGAASAVFLGGWVLWTLQEAAAPRASYASRFTAYLPRDDESTIAGNVLSAMGSKVTALLSSQLPEALGFPLTASTRWDNAIAAPLAAGGLVVGLWRLGRTARIVTLVLLAYAAVLLIWPYRGVRLLVPFLPALIAVLLVGVAAAVGRLHRPSGRAAALGLAALLVVSGIWQAGPVLSCDGSIFSRTPDCIRESEVGLGEAVAFLREDAAPGSIIMIRRGEVSYYYTGLPTVPWPLMEEVRGVPADTVLARSGADYIVAAAAYEARAPAVATLLANACERLSVAFASLPHTAVLEVHPAVDPPAENGCDLVRRHFPPPEAPAEAAEPPANEAEPPTEGVGPPGTDGDPGAD